MSRFRPASSLKRKTRERGARYVKGALVRVVKVMYPDDSTTYTVGDVGCITYVNDIRVHGMYVKFFRNEANWPGGDPAYVFRDELRLVRKEKDESAIQEG